MKDWIENHKLIRRLALLWAISLITYVTISVMQPEIITVISGAGASVVVAVIGILQTVVALYQTGRSKEDANAQDSDRRG